MLNLDEAIFINLKYLKERNLLLRIISYFFGMFIFLDLVRGQISEVNLLQLIPGFYLILLFIGLIFLVFTSDFFYRFCIEVDLGKKYGTKGINKFKLILLNRIKFFLFFTIILIALNTVVPISLDSFNSYGEKTLENIWSLNDVLSLEIFLLSILMILSQVPVFLINVLTTEKTLLFLPQFWKIISVLILLISGFLTPTIDGYTQVSFAASAFSLYVLIINLVQKRLTIKSNEIASLTS
jgi:hypothetical protein